MLGLNITKFLNNLFGLLVILILIWDSEPKSFRQKLDKRVKLEGNNKITLYT